MRGNDFRGSRLAEWTVFKSGRPALVLRIDAQMLVAAGLQCVGDDQCTVNRVILQYYRSPAGLFC